MSGDSSLWEHYKECRAYLTLIGDPGMYSGMPTNLQRMAVGHAPERSDYEMQFAHIRYRPEKKDTPNRFCRMMMRLCFGFTWVRVAK